METFLEILKYILPALVVFITVYFLMKHYLDQQYKLSSLKMRKEQFDNTLPIRLKAYERLALLCERISPDNLGYRLTHRNSNAQELARAMLVAIQQEWEHNLSQQIYVSDKLWEIITLAKGHLLETINQSAETLPSSATSGELMADILSSLQKETVQPLLAARKAIKEEVQLIF